VHRLPVGQPQAYDLGVLLDGSHGGALADLGAGGDRGGAQPVVELLAAHHRHERAVGVSSGEPASPVPGERDPVDPVVRGHLDPVPHRRERGADEAAPAGLVAGVGRAFHHECSHARAGGGMGGGEAGGAGADDGEIPDDHRCSVCQKAAPGGVGAAGRPPDRVGIFGRPRGNRAARPPAGRGR
jgi:hypothetical protein